MPIDSSSTLQEVKNSYADNASYEEDGSATKARAFITACRILLMRMPKEAGTRESNTTFNPELIQKEMDRARDWLVGNPDATQSDRIGPRVTKASFENFR